MRMQFRAVPIAIRRSRVSAIQKRKRKRRAMTLKLAASLMLGTVKRLLEHELMETVFPHPTLSEMMHEAVLDAYDRTIHF